MKKPASEAAPHFQFYQFDRGLPRNNRDADTLAPRSLSPETHATLYGDKSLRSKIANLLSGELSVFEAAAFRS